MDAGASATGLLILRLFFTLDGLDKLAEVGGVDQEGCPFVKKKLQADIHVKSLVNALMLKDKYLMISIALDLQYAAQRKWNNLVANRKRERFAEQTNAVMAVKKVQAMGPAA